MYAMKKELRREWELSGVKLEKSILAGVLIALSRGQCTAFSAVVVGGGCVRRGVGRGHPLCGRLLEAVIFVGPSIVLPPATTLNAACSCACGDRYASLCPRRKTAFTAPCFFVLQEIQSKKARGFGTHFF